MFRRRPRPAPPQRLILLTPSMPACPPALLQALFGSGAEMVIDPLRGWAPPRAPEARRNAAEVLTRELDRPLSPGQRQVIVIPAQGLYGMGRLADLLPGLAGRADLIRIDCADLLRAVLIALRAELWVTTPDAQGNRRALPIPEAEDFRPQADPHRIENMVLTLYNGRAALDLALDGLEAPTLIADRAPNPGLLARLGIPDYRPPTPRPLVELTADPQVLMALAAAQAIPTEGARPATPPIHNNGPLLLALCCGRNVADHLPVLAARMRDEAVPLIYIDNGSDDGSAEIARELPGIAAVHDLPYDGQFSVAAQLRLKAELAEAHAPQWVLNIDADEIIEHRRPGASLIDAASEAGAQGYNAVNFDEFVFLPEPDADYAGRDYLHEMRRYYLHEPQLWRLVRMYRHGAGLSNIARGGHQLLGPLRLSPVTHNLRHYMALSQGAAFRKYIGRTYAPDEVARGLHGNRLGLTEADLALPPPDDPRLSLACADGGLARERAMVTHWWGWGRAST